MVDIDDTVARKYIDNVYGATGALFGGGALSMGLEVSPTVGILFFVFALLLFLGLTLITEACIIPKFTN